MSYALVIFRSCLFLLYYMSFDLDIDSHLVSSPLNQVWDQIAPGLAHEFDAPHSILAITPRPLLILNGEEDPRCPVEGLQSAIERVVEAYYLAKSPGNFKRKSNTTPIRRFRFDSSERL
ncbi:uncharacterized protein LOC18424022 isoform X2 [Amborella trichopoda]|uniref:uncharacterized protein LOC18424022 isoform X2 n=1 Tax=Amborella trichopoda TaxID=13333 RepID=UPI0009BE5299|nr:uncharacterized protein LOC18424022 isoform X2 [Amborella trichopoda]|eukprot:XP_020532205.1 uncharacterized protein LOC18424022 isoform X2 [Amborella trichopoda]